MQAEGTAVGVNLERLSSLASMRSEASAAGVKEDRPVDNGSLGGSHDAQAEGNGEAAPGKDA